MEKIIETKTCKQCQCNFDITDRDLEFYEKVSPVFNKKKYSIPSPQMCPTCRNQRRLSFRNERSLYKWLCSATWKPMISMYSPDKPYKVYSPDVWESDKFNPLDYGREVDLSRSFFEQLEELYSDLPALWLLAFHNENSEYVSYCANVKNCYMIFASSQNEDSLNSRWVMNNTNIVDSNNISFSNHLYSCVDCRNLTHSFYNAKCFDGSHCYGSYDLQWCTHCIWCYNLRNKSYCIENKQYTKEEYEKEKQKYLSNLPEVFKRSLKNAIFCEKTSVNSDNVLWDHVVESKNTQYGFDIEKCEDSKYVTNILDMKDSMDIDFQAFETQLCYNNLWIERTTKCSFNFAAVWWANIYYSYVVVGCSDVFGCKWLVNKSYCILNKQYTKEEYEELVPKIIERMRQDWEWWEFLPLSLNPFGYNEAIVNEYFPLTKKQALEKWFHWSDYESPFPQVQKIIPADKLPKKIEDIPDDILNWAIECETTGKPFRIIPQELKFYRKHGISIPKRHPDQRHLDRMNLRNERKLYERQCDKCSKNIQTTYSSDRKETVYCEACYNEAIY